MKQDCCALFFCLFLEFLVFIACAVRDKGFLSSSLLFEMKMLKMKMSNYGERLVKSYCWFTVFLTLLRNILLAFRIYNLQCCIMFNSVLEHLLVTVTKRIWTFNHVQQIYSMSAPMKLAQLRSGGIYIFNFIWVLCFESLVFFLNTIDKQILWVLGFSYCLLLLLRQFG